MCVSVCALNASKLAVVAATTQYAFYEKKINWPYAHIQVLLSATAHTATAQQKQQRLKHLKSSIGPICKSLSTSLTFGQIKLSPNIRHFASLNLRSFQMYFCHCSLSS